MNSIYRTNWHAGAKYTFVPTRVPDATWYWTPQYETGLVRGRAACCYHKAEQCHAENALKMLASTFIGLEAMPASMYGRKKTMHIRIACEGKLKVFPRVLIQYTFFRNYWDEPQTWPPEYFSDPDHDVIDVWTAKWECRQYKEPLRVALMRRMQTVIAAQCDNTTKGKGPHDAY